MNVNGSPLTTARGAALYIGALLGPGLLLLPGLAARTAGPASVVAWIALLALSALFACVFAALGRGYPCAGGVMGYVTAGLGNWAGRAAGWSFLAGVITGAPIVCLIGAGYVTAVIGRGNGPGDGHHAQAVIAGLLLLVVLALAAGGLRSSSTAQLLLVTLLVIVVTVAVSGAGRMARAANWAPFTPHGWAAVGHAAALLMLSFVGWEAVAPLTTRFRDPRRQLARVIALALAVTTVIYLALAVTVIGVLGPDGGGSIPLAGLLAAAIGAGGPAVAAVAAVILTLGATNSYITGASAMVMLLPPLRASRSGAGAEAGPGARRARRRLLAAIAATGLPLIALYGAGLISVTPLVAMPTTLFLAVYLGCMVAAIRLLRGLARTAALPAALAVTALLLFCGWALAAPALVALVTAIPWPPGRVARCAAAALPGQPRPDPALARLSR
jgi:amino acid efflux transporter